MIEAIFLDAGGVILDESPFEIEIAEIITYLISKIKNYSTEQYWNDIEEAIYRFVSSTYEYVIFKNTNNLDQFNEILDEYQKRFKLKNIPFKLMSGLIDMLKRFSSKYKFGILGQYGDDFKDYLDKKGILKYFTFTETQENYKITKPDIRYFEEILKNAKCNPNNCVMIGDRIDKDIIPANVIGMKTIRLKTGIHKDQKPRIPIEIPNVEINSLDEITEEIITNLGYDA